jgi:2,3-diaminopropionate biosynthesis protein SbnB
MLYLNEEDIFRLGIPWLKLIETIEQAVYRMKDGDFAQPMKPYLRYGNPKNRIIAMPAYVGGDIDIAGIKWIASFPDNHKLYLPRAHSVLILNDASTGRPVAIINGSLLSILRTASVSGLMIREYLQTREPGSVTVGIIGWGPIGQYHFKMCTEIYGELIDHIFLYDLKGIDPITIESDWRRKVKVADCWQDAYRSSDIFITCTVSDYRYIDEKPKDGSLLLNVSLRDYTLEALDHMKTIIVDDWDEVCRENTDIELLHKERGLTREQTLSMVSVVCNGSLSEIDRKYNANQPIFFSPMGLVCVRYQHWRVFFQGSRSDYGRYAPGEFIDVFRTFTALAVNIRQKSRTFIYSKKR